MKDLMIITSYYPPEIGAASNRIYHLAEGLKQDYNISIVTPLPNYPTGRIFKGYRGEFMKTSYENRIKTHRLWLYATNSKNKLQRLTAMLSYSVSLIIFFAFNKIPKTVIVQSPPLLVAFTSIFFLRSNNRKLILNVSDLWPSAGLELGALKQNIGYNWLQKIERFNYKHADIVMGQSEEILEHVTALFSNKKTLLYRNFPDFEPPAVQFKPCSCKDKITLVYAGLLGVAQGILKLCESLDYTNVELHIYGSGSEEQAIKSFISINSELPIYFYGKLDRRLLHEALLQYDLTIIPLRNRIFGSVPSKIFEYAKLGIPMVYFGGGEGETLVEFHNLGWVVPVNDYKALNTLLKSISKEDTNLGKRQTIQLKAIEVFDFKKQLNRLKKIL